MKELIECITSELSDDCYILILVGDLRVFVLCKADEVIIVSKNFIRIFDVEYLPHYLTSLAKSGFSLTVRVGMPDITKNRSRIGFTPKKILEEEAEELYV